MRAGWSAGLRGGALITVPPPGTLALPSDVMEAAIAQALGDADREGVTGKRITPYLLAKVAEITGGRSMAVNLALLEQNARIAARIALAMV